MNFVRNRHIDKRPFWFRLHHVLRYFALVSVLLGTSSCMNKNEGSPLTVQAIGTSTPYHYNIEGILDGVHGAKIALYSITPDYSYVPLDSTTVKAGRFTFNGMANGLTPAVLTLNDSIPLSSLFLEEGNTKVSINLVKESDFEGYFLSDFILEGTPGNELYQGFQKELKTIESSEAYLKMDELAWELWQMEDTVVQTNAKSYLQLSRKMTKLQDSIDDAINGLRKNFVLQNNASPLAPYILFNEGLGFNQDAYTIEELQMLFNTLDVSLANNPYYQLCQEKLERAIQLLPGQQAPNFAFHYANHPSNSLSNLKGNYVLLEFWAYWCAPCLESLPELKQLYETNQGQDLTVLSIHDNYEQNIWLETHNNLKLPWEPVFMDNKGTNDTAVWQLYDIENVPTNYLIDNKGNLVGRNLTIDDIARILKNDL
ncbi:MAG: thioredoxin-like domain-containing protein [Croceivirga sp.]